MQTNQAVPSVSSADAEFQSLTSTFRRLVPDSLVCALATASLLGGCADKKPISPQPVDGISQMVVDKTMESVVVIRTPYGGGSGFFVADEKTGEIRILTAKHVYTEREPSFYEMQINGDLLKAGKHVPPFQDLAEVSCFEPGGRESAPFKAMAQKIPKPDALLTAVVPEFEYAMSGLYDVALLVPVETISAAHKPAGLIFRDCIKEPLQPGEPVFTVGHPDGHPHFFCTRGKINAPVLEDSNVFLGTPVIDLQLDVHGGNSGGPLLDAKGRVIGIVIRQSLETKGRGFAMAFPSFEHLSSEWGFAMAK